MDKKANQCNDPIDEEEWKNQNYLTEDLNINQKIYSFKLILLGDIAVGKTSILNRFVDNKFQSHYKCTINIDYRIKSLSINSETSTDLQIWDTCGEEKYYSITRQYFHNVNGIILVFDLSNYATLEKISYWVDDVKNYIKQEVSITLVGNKEDIETRPVFASQTAREFARKKKIEYIEVSAKTGKNVIYLFEHISKHLIRKINLNQKNHEKTESDIGNHNYHTKTLSTDGDNRLKKNNEEKEGCC